jgi:acetyl CoA:N6-hydroxylysine acetyl transferase
VLPEAASRADTASEVFDPALRRTIAFRRMTLEQDLERLHDWMNRPHVVPFWRLNRPLEELRTHFERALRVPHQTLHIGLLDSVPMSYWETYWAVDDVIACCYRPDPSDQGVHLLIGPPEFLGKGLALPLLRAMVRLLFHHVQTKKIVAEPDIRNARMIHVFERCSFEFVKRIQLPDKEAALMFCHRQRFEAEIAHAER